MEMTKKSVSVSRLKSHLSEYLRQVKAGEQWTITERGRPIAILGPSPNAEHPLSHLAAEGAVRLGTGTLSPEFWDLPHPEDPESLVREAVADERAKGW